MQDGIDNFIKRTKASIGKLKDQLKSIPFRIDECNNSIMEVDTETLEFQKKSIVGGWSTWKNKLQIVQKQMKKN